MADIKSRLRPKVLNFNQGDNCDYVAVVNDGQFKFGIV